MVKIEFFHDVICSFCFPMSYRMRQIEKQVKDIEIIHRSFALIRTEKDFDYQFGSRNAAKREILNHWEQANKNDDLHRFNIEGMKKANFPFPTSIPALIACKAAYFCKGESAYWDMFDSLQNAFFVENKNIESQEVIQECAKKISIDFDDWKNANGEERTKKAIENDFKIVNEYGIQSAPSLVIENKIIVSGAQSLDAIKASIEKARN